MPENTQVYYTLDGSTPTTNSTLYTDGEEVDIARVTVLRARAFDTTGRLQPSDTITQTYLLNLSHCFPLVTLVPLPYELFTPITGLPTVGN